MLSDSTIWVNCNKWGQAAGTLIIGVKIIFSDPNIKIVRSDRIFENRVTTRSKI